MASDVLYAGQKDYFDVKTFENSISNAGLERQKRIATRKSLRLVDRLLVIAFIVILLVTACIFGRILYEDIKIMKMNRQIAKLEIALDKKSTENSEIIDDIKDTMRYDNLKVKAYLDLNMVLPSEENIIYFDKSDSEYVRQYENIRE